MVFTIDGKKGLSSSIGQGPVIAKLHITICICERTWIFNSFFF